MKRGKTELMVLTILVSVLLPLTFLVVSCVPAPVEEIVEEPMPVVEEPAPVVEPGVTIEVSPLFPDYPTTLPAHLDPEAVVAAMAKAEELWVQPLRETDGWVPVIRPAQQRWKIGFIEGLSGFPANTRMVESAKIAADLMGVDLVFADSKFDAEASITAAHLMVDLGVDGVINSNWYAPSMDAMGEILAGIPTVVNEVPMPGGIFFGVDNLTAGRMAGEYLVNWVKENYEGNIADIWVVNNENPDVGEVPAMRLSGMEQAIREAFPEIPEHQFVRIPGGSFTDESFEAMTTWLTAHPDVQMVLSTNINDNGAVGAATAWDIAWRHHQAAVVGHGGEAQAWNELDRPEEWSAFKATVDYVQNEYGRYLVPIIVDLIEGRPVPDTIHNYMYLLDRENMHKFEALRPRD